MPDEKTSEIVVDTAPALTDRALTLEDPTGTPITKMTEIDDILALNDSRTKTFTNTTYDAQGTGNTLSNVGTSNISDDAVTYAKIQNVTQTDVFLGRDTVGAGIIEEITASAARAILNVADGANNYTHPNHTGDVTSTGDGATTISNSVVTYSKIQNVSATDRFLGRDTAGAGPVEEITASAARTILNVADGANNYVHPNHTGDVTSTGDGATVIANNTVTYAKMQDVSATARFLGRITAGAGDTEELTGTQATTLLDNFTSGLKGLAPSSGGGTTNFLRADGTWAAPPGSGSVGTQQFWLPASVWKPTATSGAAGLTTREFGANNQNIEAMEFTPVADSYAYTNFAFPQNYDLGTIKFKYYWFVENDDDPPESLTCSFDMDAVSLSNFGALGGTAYGTAVTLNDTTDSTAAENKINISAQSSALTIAGTPADFDLISLRIMQDVSDATFDGSIYLVGVMIEYTIDAGTSTG